MDNISFQPHLIQTTLGSDSPVKHATNMVECLRYLARVRPNDTALITVNTDKSLHFSYQELEQKVLALAAYLQKKFVRGDRALILQGNDEQYVISFLACLYAGLVAVPIFPPESMREKHLSRLVAIAEDASPSCLLTTSTFLSLIKSHVSTLNEITAIAVDCICDTAYEQWEAYSPTTNDIAFLQYTSGSTATPKGVMVSHGNLFSNEMAIQKGFSIQPDDIMVSWLPLYHDMGLIGGLLQPLFSGIPVVLMSPAYFLQSPIRWLEVISHYKGTVSGGPDFSYRLCLERIKQSQLLELDLSSWRIAMSGAEPIRHDTLTLFADKFSVSHFSADALFPSYGLAEATLFVSGCGHNGITANRFNVDALTKNKAELDEQGQFLVSSGFVAEQHQIAIMATDNMFAVPDGDIGEIWVSGPSVARGYWKNDQATADTFIEYKEQRWLRTGDLGFVYQQELYITGRMKDVIILRGHNLYPQDIERVIEEECYFVRKGRIAAFSVTKPDGTEGIGLALEVPTKVKKQISLNTLFSALAETLSSLCQESISVVLLLNKGTLPKTSSGKLQRSACRKSLKGNLLGSSLDSYACYFFGEIIGGESEKEQLEERIDDELQQEIAQMWCEVLENTELRLSPTSNFFILGGNSVQAIRLLALISERFDITIQPADFLESPTIAALAELIELILIEEIEQTTV